AGSTSYIDATAAASTEYDYRIQSTGSGVSSAFASLSTSTPAGIGDGIPGAWRYQYFGNGTTVTAASGTHADPDSDGMDNLQEYLSGTIPTDASSALRASVALSGSDVLVTFPSVSGKTYLLQRTSDLAVGPWTTIQDNISGTGGNITLTDPGVTGSPRFYRVELK
ncbi:MAG TPA: hypothetical protein VNB29_04375, partial [Chthoniobacterales bacterium]|nr:hypothetical protein [Chthoniobacterales bacterium]